MKRIIEVREIPLDEKVYLRKRKSFGWSVVHPIRNEDGTINWLNLLVGGSWWNLFIVGIIVIIVLGCVYQYSKDINILLDCFKDPIQLETCKQSFGYYNLFP